MARNTAFARQVELVSQQIGEARRQQLIDLAKQQFAAADRQNTEVLGRPAEYQTIVDGRMDADPSSVKAEGGTITYLFKVGPASLEEAVDEAFRLLAELSPVLTGTYQNSFRLFINDVEHDAAKTGGPIALKMTDEIAITNFTPYARRIEKGWSKRAPNGVMEAATTALRARYGNLLTILFTYRGYVGGDLVNAMKDPTRRKGPRLRGAKGRFKGSEAAAGPKAYNKAASRWPTMTIRVK